MWGRNTSKPKIKWIRENFLYKPKLEDEWASNLRNVSMSPVWTNQCEDFVSTLIFWLTCVSKLDITTKDALQDKMGHNLIIVGGVLKWIFGYYYKGILLE